MLCPPCKQLRPAFAIVLLFAHVSWTSNGMFGRTRWPERSASGEPPIDSQGSTTSTLEALRLGQALTKQINGGESQSFRVSLTSGDYVRLVVQLRGIILRATLFDPAGKELVVMNNPSGGYGPIYISEIASAFGEYQLEVRSTEDWANPGSFTVGIDELRASTPEDARRIEAERWFANAVKEDEARSFKSAADEYAKALAYWQAIHDPHWEALTQYALSQTYRRSGNLKKAEECLIESLKIEVAENDWRLKASALNDLGFNKAQGADNEKGISLLNQSLLLYEAHGDRRGQASSLNNLAITRGRMGELRKARELAERALPLRQAENFQSGVNNLRNTLGNIYDKLGDPYKSLEYHSQALEGWQQLAQANQLDGPDRLANAFNSVALATEKVGNWDQASQYYDEALRVPTTGTALRVAILNNKGELYASLGDLDTAMNYFSEARTLLDSLEKVDPDLKASVLLQIGQVNASTGKLDQALEYFQRARATSPNKPKAAYILTALGDAWSRQGNAEEARKAYAEALKIQLEIEDRRGQAITRQKLGEAYALSGDPAAASKEYELALSLWRAVLDRRGEAATLNNIALLERGRNNLSEALQRSEQATSILESLRTSVSSHQLRTSYFASHENYYELNIDLNMMFSQRDQSAQHVAAALAASERSRARSLIDTLTEARADITEGVSDELLRLESEVQRKLRAKLEAQTVLLSTRHNESEAEAISKEVSGLIRQQDEIRGRIRASNPKYSQLTHPQILTLTEIQHQLDGDTLLLEYSLGDKRSYVWAVTPDSIKGFELPGREGIEATALRLTKSLTEPNREVKNESPEQWRWRLAQADVDYSVASAALSKMVIEPVAALLGSKRLVIVADGALQLVSFGALPGSKSAGTAETATAKAKPTNNNSATDDPRPLIEDHEIVYLPSASVLALQRHELENRKPATHAVAVLADPVFDQEGVKREMKIRGANRASARQPRQQADTRRQSGANTNARSDLTRALDDIGLNRFPQLPYSRTEAEAIISVAPKGESKAALGFDASRSTAMSPELSKYRIIHFATHGVVDFEHPELSGIVLSMVDEKGQPQDGYLRLHEIYNLNLPAELVVLSACQTGVGKQIKGEGLIALTRGFMYAGAPRVVASLWKVDDAATAELMAEFYKQMLTYKLKPAAALQAAQVKISQQRRWHSPYFWAGFVLQGEWK
jgi:CHAT domain-containing protein